MKILINTPWYKKPYGGVANFYYGLKPYWKESVEYNIVGRRFKISGAFLLPYDVLKFILKLIWWNPDIVLLNPSLDYKAIKRDAVFLKTAKMLNKKCAVYIHGFSYEYAERMDKKKFSKVFNKADLFFVLANDFKKCLRKWGVTLPIFLSSAKVYDKLLEGFIIDNRQGKVKNLLFMCRLEKEKGVFIALEAFKILSYKYPDLILNIVGKGSACEEVKEYVNANHLNQVKIWGHIPEKDLVSTLIKNDLYVFPTCYGEGMPTSVLEAMAFGLPVITRPVGGLADFFTENMGVMTESMEPEDFARAIELYINNEELTRKTSIYNHTYALENFLASKVAGKIEDVLKRICIKTYK